MTEHQSVKGNLLNPKLDKLKSATKNATGVTLRLSWDMVSSGETNVLDNLLLTNHKLQVFVARLSRIVHHRIQNFQGLVYPR